MELNTNELIDEVKIDGDLEVIMVSDNEAIAISDTLKIRLGDSPELVLFKTEEGYIADLTTMTECWEIKIGDTEYTKIYPFEDGGGNK